MHRSCLPFATLVLLALLAPAPASADASPASSSSSVLPGARAPVTSQGVAVLATGAAREEAFALARAVYGSSLRPRSLNELHARILGGDPAPVASSKELRDLAELRASVVGDDAASRSVLATVARQVGVQAILVVSRVAASVGPAADDTRPQDAPDGGTEATPPPAPQEPVAPRAAPPTTLARLFLADTGEFDAARYEPDPSTPTPWRRTIASLSGRFPPPPTPAAAQLQGAPPKLSSEGKDGKPFYTSPWLWGAIGAAALIGAFFYFASQDTSADPIHLQMRVPR